MEFQHIRVTVANGIGRVTLARPPVNAQNRQMREEIIGAFDMLSDHDDVRVVILSAEGNSFSAGADIKERRNFSGRPGEYIGHNRLTRGFFDAVADCEKPVICLVDGPAIGAGFALMLQCDIMIATDRAWFQMPEIDVGLAGGGRLVEKHLGRAWARMLYFTGRKVSGDELYRLGTVVACLPSDQAIALTEDIATQIASKELKALASIKRGFQMAEPMPERDAYRYEQSITYDLSKRAETRALQQTFGKARKTADERGEI
jgi:enoyl-CoA hydratase